MLEALFDGDEATLRAAREKVFDLESQADAIFDNLSSRLSQHKFLPVHRHDLIAVLREQEAIADTAQDIAGLAELRTMTLPPTLREPLLDLVRRVLAACEHAERIINELDELVETGFRGREVGLVEGMIDELEAMEG